MPLRGAGRRMEPEPFDLVEEGPVADIEKSSCAHAIPVGLLKREEDDPTFGRFRSCPGDLFEADAAILELPGDLLVIAIRACPTREGRHHSLDHLFQLLDTPIPPRAPRRAWVSVRAFVEAFNIGGGDDVPSP